MIVFQYPVRPASMPYDDVDVSQARIKPVNKQVTYYHYLGHRPRQYSVRLSWSYEWILRVQIIAEAKGSRYNLKIREMSL